MEIERNKTEAEKQEKKVRKRKKGLYRSLVTQLEFYFSDANMTKSKFMQGATKDSPWVEVATFLKFNKINSLLTNFGCENPLKELTKALEVVPSDLLEAQDGKVKRKIPLVPKANEDECTVYVENIPPEMDHDTLKKIFTVYGNVVYVSIPKFRDCRLNKGFAFVEFEEIDFAKKALEAFGLDSSIIDTKMEPGDLISIKTFNEENGKELSKENVENESNPMKRKKDKTDEDEGSNKKVRLEDDDDELKKKKKKSRLRKESGTEGLMPQGDGQSSGIRILSKIEWKRLRNQYLNLQRKNMKLAKTKYRKQAFQTSHKQKETEVKEIEPVKPKVKEIESVKPKETGGQPSDALAMTPNIIVKVTVEDGVDDVKKLKQKIRDLLGGEAVGYVDARVGAPVVHVRCKDEQQAKKLASVPAQEGWRWDKIQGEEEEKYWKKIEDDRQDKRQGKVKIPKEKKKNKLIKNIEKSKSVHIYFGE